MFELQSVSLFWTLLLLDVFSGLSGEHVPARLEVQPGLDHMSRHSLGCAVPSNKSFSCDLSAGRCRWTSL